MPIYEFSCSDCKVLYNFFSRRINPDGRPVCPRCGKALSKRISLFRAKSGETQQGEWDAGDDEENPNVADFDTSDPRVRRAVAEMGDKIDKLDDTDTAGAAKLMREFADKSGIKFNGDVNQALSEMSSGADADAVAAKFGDALDTASTNPFSAQSAGLSADATDVKAKQNVKLEAGVSQTDISWTKDPTLYDM